MEKKPKFTIVNALIFVAILLGIVLVYRSTLSGNWDGEGEISIFPVSDNVKNYRLEDQSIKVERKVKGLFSTYEIYTVSYIRWPNEGEISFQDNCTISTEQGGKQATCVDQNGKQWVVEVTSPPSPPEADNGDY